MAEGEINLFTAISNLTDSLLSPTSSSSFSSSSSPSSPSSFSSSSPLSTPSTTTSLFPYCGLDLTKAELPVIFLTSLLVNSVSFVVLLRMRGTCDTVDHLLVSLLNLNDLLTTAMFTAMWVIGLASCGDLLLSDGVCSVLGWLGSTLVMWSAFIILIMAGLRCLSLVKPFYYRSHVTGRSVTRAAAGSLLFCAAIFFLPFTGRVKPFMLYTENMICAMDFAPGGGTELHRGVIGFIGVMALLIIATVLVCNVLIIGTLRYYNVVHVTRVTSLPSTAANSVIIKRRMFQRVTLVVSLVYVLCYLPFTVRILSDTVNNVDHQNNLVHSVTMSLLFLSPFLNPFVYGMFNKGFRDTLVSLATCKKKQPTHSSSNNSRTI